MKDNIVIWSLFALGIFLIPLILLGILAISYGMLFGINYFLEATSFAALSPFEIEITHVLLGAVFLAVMFKSNSGSKSSVERLGKSLSYDLNDISYKLQQLSTDLDNLEDIRSSVESIDRNVDDIHSKKVRDKNEYGI